MFSKIKKKMKQTAVEWLVEQLNKNTWYDESNYPQVNIGVIDFEQAKEMEKQQIINAWIATDNELQRISAEKYYNETFKK
jgi:hypothetical protein